MGLWGFEGCRLTSRLSVGEIGVGGFEMMVGMIGLGR